MLQITCTIKYYTAFGFQHYEKAEEARAAADALNGTEYNGNTLKVEVLFLFLFKLFKKKKKL